MDPWNAVGAPTRRMDLADRDAELRVRECPPARRSAPPGIEAAPSNAQAPAHEANREAGPLRLDEAKQRHRMGSVSLAKKAAAFFRRSRSIRKTRFSARSRDRKSTRLNSS